MNWTAGECIVVSSSSSSSSSSRPSGNSGVVSSSGGNGGSNNSNTAVYGRLVPEEQLAALGRGLSVINPNAAINSSSSLGNLFVIHIWFWNLTHSSLIDNREFIFIVWRWLRIHVGRRLFVRFTNDAVADTASISRPGFCTAEKTFRRPHQNLQTHQRGNKHVLL